MGNEIDVEILTKVNSLKNNKSPKIGKSNNNKINIGDLLKHRYDKNNDENNAHIISKEQYTFGKKSGMLIRYDDGTAVFQAKGKDNTFVSEYHFKNDKDIEKKQPSSIVTYNPKMPSSKLIQNFEYHRNGNISHKQITNAKGNVMKDCEYNKDGKLEKTQMYNNEGELIRENKYKYNKNNTLTIASYDKNKQLDRTTNVQLSEDGKKFVSSQTKDADGNLIAEAKYADNGKISESTTYYKNGQIKSKTKYNLNGVATSTIKYDENGKEIKNNSQVIDGHFGNSAQVSEGDCYLLASINSLRNTEQGQEILKNLVTVSTNANGEKVYTVEFPGAKIAAEGLRTDKRINPNKMYITGKYTFTESEMREICSKAGREYSSGDGDVILIEAAFEKYREEVDRTLDANHIDKRRTRLGEAGLQTGHNDDNILAGGRSEDAIFVLTGKRSKLYMNRHLQNGLSYEALQAGKADVVSLRRNNMLSAKVVSQIDGNIETSKQTLNKMLDEVMIDQRDGKIDKIAVADFPVVHKDGTIGGHALTIKSVSANTVTLINPWYPDKEITMSRQDFLQSAQSVSLSDVNKAPAKPTGGSDGGDRTNVSNTHPNNNGHSLKNNIPLPNKIYKVPQGATYTDIIKTAMKVQGIKITPENIRKAKAQFKAANPGAVKTYNGKNRNWHGNEFLLANSKVKIPQFKM